MHKRIVFALCAAMFFAGCDAGYGPDETHPVYRKAMRCRSSGKYQEAEALLKRFLKSRPKSAQGCLALAQLYDEKLNDPLSAVYYYREFLKLEPDSTESRDVRNLMKRCEERMQSAQTGQKQTKKLADENIRLKRTLLQYGKNMEKMRVELKESEKRVADAENKASQAEAAARAGQTAAMPPAPAPENTVSAEKKKEAAPVAAEAPEMPEEVIAYAESAAGEDLPEMPALPEEKAPKKISKEQKAHPDSLSLAFPAAGLSATRPRRVVSEFSPMEKKAAAPSPAPGAKTDRSSPSEWPKTYTVKPGDSLSAISRNFYGTTQYYTKIMEANHITNTRGLAIGQKLILPAPTKEVRK